MTAATVPMRSVKIAPGRYEVLGTSKHCEVVKVWKGGAYGSAPAWHLIVDEEWWQTFPTKRAALQACQENPEL